MENEEFDYKLTKNNTVLTAKTITDITISIKNKFNNPPNSHQNCLNLGEFKYLKQKCLSGDSSISCAAANGMVRLVKWNLIEVSKMMSEVTAMIPFAQNHKGLLVILFDLLIMDMETKLEQSGSYKCPFNLAIPQHPIISVLVHNGNDWNLILSCIKKVYLKGNKRYKEALNELFRPVYLYILCDPHTKTSELCRINFLKFLIEDESNIFVVENIIGWLQISSIETQIYTCNVLIILYESNLAKTNEHFKDFILFWLLSLLLEICTMKSDPSEIILVLNKFELKNHKDLELILVFFSKCIEIVQHSYLNDLLTLCLKMLPDRLSHLTSHILQSSLLNWLLYSSDLLHNSQTLLNTLFNKIKNIKDEELINFDFQLDKNPFINSFLNTNQHLHLTIQVFKLINKKPLERNIKNFLNTSNNFSPFLLKHTIIFTKAIFLYELNQEKEIILKSLSLLLKDVSNHTNTSNSTLTFFLYKLANTKDSNVHFEVLKAIVQLGKFRENVHVIIATLKTLSKVSPQMKTFVLSLFFDLWKNELKCYFLVQSMLVDENKLDARNFSVTKAYVIRELCKLKAELYGSELAIYISKILNSCKTDDGLATSFVLEGLTHLCTKGIIDITTAWDTLEPSFRSETRTNVIISFCNLLSEVENLYVETKKFDKMICDVVGKLWDYVLNQTDVGIINAAYGALATFRFDVVGEQFLEIYQGKLVSEDYWCLTLLNDHSYINLDSTVTFIVNFLKKEITEYGRGIYYVLESKAEPNNYEYLPSKSILRGLMAHIKRNFTSRSKVEIACFKILAQDYPKPLPPLDWCFLQEFVHDGNFREFCITIAARQVILSGTARRFLENLIIAITQNPNKDDLWWILTNIKHFCNSIQPAIIKPFFETGLNYALNESKNDNDDFLNFIINKIKELMEKEDFQDVNKNVIIKIIIDKSQEVDLESKEFNKSNECISRFPYPTIKPLITPKSWMDFSSKNLKRSLKLCENLIQTNETPMVYYNEIINALGDELIDVEYFLTKISDVTHSLKDHPTLPNWFLELLGQTQLELIDSNHFSKRISFMCDVLIVTVVSISDQKMFLDNFIDDKNENYMKNMIKLLPQAFVVILKDEKWNKYTTQILEWLYYMINYETTPLLYRKGFYHSLIALRHEPEFKSTLKWLKYIGCRCVDDI